MKEPLIKGKNIVKIFHDENSTYEALKGASLMVYEGEFIGISGSSGSGKTTLLGLLGCLELPTEGELDLFGFNVYELDDQAQSDLRLSKIGYIFQEHNLLPALTVYENLELPMRLLKKEAEEIQKRVDELLEVVELGELGTRYPSQLSRGQRQRIAAIRAFVNNPSVILADEPTSDLDPTNSSIILELLYNLNREKKTTIIMAATDPELFNGYTTRNLRLIDGKLHETTSNR